MPHKHSQAEMDAAYAAAYADHPLSEPDAWGDLESWHEAAAGGRFSAPASRPSTQGRAWPSPGEPDDSVG